MTREKSNKLCYSGYGIGVGLLLDTVGLENSQFVRYRLEVVEQKTGKSRVFTVPLVIQQYIENYCLRNGIRWSDLMFPITERAVDVLEGSA